jgi:1,4-alpha-glucan branching enzyme
MKRAIVQSASLTGSWDSSGKHSSIWCKPIPMQPIAAEDGCPAFAGTVQLREDAGRDFQWGVIISTAARNDIWGIMPEVHDRSSSQRYRTFTLGPDKNQTATYYLTHGRRLGAKKYFGSTNQAPPELRLAVLAPNAKQVGVVMGKTWDIDDPAKTPLSGSGKSPRSINVEKIAGGYIEDAMAPQGAGESYGMQPIEDGIWATSPSDPGLKKFSDFDHRCYMYRVTNKDGTTHYRTDLHSRCQVGAGATNPHGALYAGRVLDLDGIGSCSAVIDPETVTRDFEERNEHGEVIFPETKWVSTEEFWRDEFQANRPVPHRLQDLVIYELHLGTLGFDHAGPGTLADAMKLVDYLEMLGVNAVELLPLAEFGTGGVNWGYGTSHYFSVEYAGGGRDKYKFFIRECHRRGIAVIVDVVYNHYTFQPERAEEYYDSHREEENVYYWYEGRSSDYASPNDGYCQNGSSGRCPRFHEEAVRQMFISSAAVLLEEFHVDGFRVDLTQAIHRDNHLEGADHRAVPNANIFGVKFLREWCRSLKLLNPNVMLVAEDHTGWSAVVDDPDAGGLGFDATWYADFYHNLSGDTKHDGAAQLLRMAGFGDERPLAMDTFAGVLWESRNRRVVYHESHDEAGNSPGTERTMRTAVQRAPLVGPTRRYAEARSRVAAALSILSAGTPMFLFGEEVATDTDFTYGNVLAGKVDLWGLRAAGGSGRGMFQYYGDLCRLRIAHKGFCSRNLDVLFCHNDHRLIAVHRWDDEEDDLLVIASLNNRPFDRGYVFSALRIPDGGWKEIFNSDAAAYGGDNVGNGSGTLTASGGRFEPVVPANGVVVFKRT